MLKATNVCIVEDSEDDAYLMRCEVLRLFPDAAVSHVSTLAALRVNLACNSAPYDIAIVDMSLPDGCGFDAACLLKKTKSLVILISGGAVDYLSTFRDDVDGFAKKPLSARVLKALLRGTPWRKKMSA